MHRIVFLDRATLAPDVVLKRPTFAHEWVEYDRTTAEETFERVKGATIVLVNKVNLREDLIARLPKPKLIAVAATGYDCVDVAAAKARGIVVANIRGYAKATVPEQIGRAHV
jgi:glycerate dehydrogenase